LIENIIYKIIWNIPTNAKPTGGKIRRETLQAPVKGGGLNAPIIKSLNDALKYKQLLRCLSNEHPIGHLTRYKLQRLNFSCNTQLTKTLKDDLYIYQAINTHNKR
jgi:hypothetical protein